MAKGVEMDIAAANRVAKAEGGIFRVEAIRGVGADLAAILWAEEGPNHGATYWQGPVDAVLAEVRMASIRTRVLRLEVSGTTPELESY